MLFSENYIAGCELMGSGETPSCRSRQNPQKRQSTHPSYHPSSDWFGSNQKRAKLKSSLPSVDLSFLLHESVKATDKEETSSLPPSPRALGTQSLVTMACRTALCYIYQETSCSPPISFKYTGKNILFLDLSVQLQLSRDPYTSSSLQRLHRQGASSQTTLLQRSALFVCFLCLLASARVTWEDRTSVEKITPPGWSAGKFVGHILA